MNINLLKLFRGLEKIYNAYLRHDLSVSSTYWLMREYVKDFNIKYGAKYRWGKTFKLFNEWQTKWRKNWEW